MKEEGKPVDQNFQTLQEILEAYQQEPMTTDPNKTLVVDFTNTAIAFSDKSDRQLKKSYWLFRMMNQPRLVSLLSKIGLFAVRFRIPLANLLVRRTIYEQFVGGRTLLESLPTIERLYKSNVYTMLDYGAEGKERERDFNITMNETIRAIEFATTNESVPVVSAKITGLARFGLLEKIQRSENLSEREKNEYDNILKRVDSICHTAEKRGVSVFFDAEESWIQDTIDYLVTRMMERYNKKRAVVYNTFQMYRTDRLQYLLDSYKEAQKKGYILGAKLVRGAYMDKERERAAEVGYPDPIQPNKAATDDAYNTAIRFCVDHYQQIASANASHNAASCLLQAELIQQKGIQRDHPHLNFCQLYGMSDHLTYNLAKEGFNVAKYVPYGAVREVVPYLVRRAQENSSVTGDMSRELDLINREMKRRSLLS